eukprot:gene23345-30595_t
MIGLGRSKPSLSVIRSNSTRSEFQCSRIMPTCSSAPFQVGARSTVPLRCYQHTQPAPTQTDHNTDDYTSTDFATATSASTYLASSGYVPSDYNPSGYSTTGDTSTDFATMSSGPADYKDREYIPSDYNATDYNTTDSKPLYSNPLYDNPSDNNPLHNNPLYDNPTDDNATDSAPQETTFNQSDCTSTDYTLTGQYISSEYKPSDYTSTDFTTASSDYTDFTPSDYNATEYNPSGNIPSEYKPSEYMPTASTSTDFTTASGDYTDYTTASNDYTDYTPLDYNATDYTPSEYSATDYTPSDYKPTDSSLETTFTDISWFGQARANEMKFDLATEPSQLLDLIMDPDQGGLRMFPETAASILLKLVSWQIDSTLSDLGVADSALHSAVAHLETQIMLDISSVSPPVMANIVWSLAKLRSRSTTRADVDAPLNLPPSATATYPPPSAASSSLPTPSSPPSSHARGLITTWPVSSTFVDGVVAWSKDVMAETQGGVAVGGLSLCSAKDLSSMLWGFGFLLATDEQRQAPGFSHAATNEQRQAPGFSRVAHSAVDAGYSYPDSNSNSNPNQQTTSGVSFEKHDSATASTLASLVCGVGPGDRIEFLDSLAAFLGPKVKMPLINRFQPIDLSQHTMELMDGLAKEANRQMNKKGGGLVPFLPADEVKLLRAFADMGACNGTNAHLMFETCIPNTLKRMKDKSMHAISKPADTKYPYVCTNAQLMFETCIANTLKRMKDKSMYAISKPADILSLLSSIEESQQRSPVVCELVSACCKHMNLLCISYNQDMMDEYMPPPRLLMSSSSSAGSDSSYGQSTFLLDPWRQRQAVATLSPMSDSWAKFVPVSVVAGLMRTFHGLGVYPGPTTMTSLVLAAFHQLPTAPPASVTSLITMLAEFNHHPGEGVLQVLMASVGKNIGQYSGRQLMEVLGACAIFGYLPPQDLVHAFWASDMVESETVSEELVDSEVARLQQRLQEILEQHDKRQKQQQQQEEERHQGEGQQGHHLHEGYYVQQAQQQQQEIKRQKTELLMLVTGGEWRSDGNRSSHGDSGILTSTPTATTSATAATTTVATDSNASQEVHSRPSGGSSGLEGGAASSPADSKSQGVGVKKKVGWFGRALKWVGSRVGRGSAESGVGSGAAGSGGSTGSGVYGGSAGSVVDSGTSARPSRHALRVRSFSPHMSGTDTASVLYASICNASLRVDVLSAACWHLHETLCPSHTPAPFGQTGEGSTEEEEEARASTREQCLLLVAVAARALGAAGEAVLERTLLAGSLVTEEMAQAVKRYLGVWVKSQQAVSASARDQVREALSALGLESRVVTDPVLLKGMGLDHTIIALDLSPEGNSSAPGGVVGAAGENSPDLLVLDLCEGGQVACNSAGVVMGEARFRGQLLRSIVGVHHTALSVVVLESSAPSQVATYLLQQMRKAGVALSL